MNLYVTVEQHQGVIAEIHAYRTEESADEAERQWLKKYDIHDEISREGKAQNGTEFLIWECELSP